MYKGKKKIRTWLFGFTTTEIVLIIFILSPSIYMIWQICTSIVMSPATTAKNSVLIQNHKSNTNANINVLEKQWSTTTDTETTNTKKNKKNSDSENKENENENESEKIMHMLSAKHRSVCESILNGQQHETDNDLKKQLKTFAPTYEDFYIYHHFFSSLSTSSSSSLLHHHHHHHRHRGVYLEIGNYQPLKESVAAFFDLCLGWKGVCVYSPDAVDGSPFTASPRSCLVVNEHCLWKINPVIIRSNGGHDDSQLCTQEWPISVSIEHILNKY